MVDHEDVPDRQIVARTDRIEAAERETGIVLRPFGWTPKLAAAASRPNPDEALTPEAAALVFAGMNKNTEQTYRTQWWKFVRWCGDTGRAHEPGQVTPATIIEWMNELWRRRGRYGRPTAPASVALSLKTIAVAHKRAKRREVDESGRPLYGFISPTTHHLVQAAFRGYTQQWLAAGHRPDKAHPLSADELTKMIATLDVRTPMGLCDATLLAVGYDLGGRRVELCNLNIGDVELRIRDVDDIRAPDPDDDEPGDSVVINIPMSKTDQRGEGADIPLTAHPPEFASTCPVRLSLRWLAALDAVGQSDPRAPFFQVVSTGGPRPRDGRPKTGVITGKRIGRERVEDVVERTSIAADLQPKTGRRLHIVPHSLRAGSATAAAEGGADKFELDDHYRWSHRGTTAGEYVRAGRRKLRNPTRRIWRRRKARGAGEA